ncbi:MAG: MTH938/NDUFAF3 family protein [Candidatus Aenigmarchaeota archaeon]|jgi:hypothetical protein|nr:MTH938/NDUFAF3 family protein [Candidatus Aenigmarchaeota archaeon]
MVRIDSMKFGEIKIDGKDYYSDVAVWWDGKIEFIVKSHQFGMNELLNLLKKKPEAVVIGTGIESCVEILEEVTQEMENRELMLFVENSRNAIEIFNGLVSEGKKAVAFIHVTL